MHTPDTTPEQTPTTPDSLPEMLVALAALRPERVKCEQNTQDPADAQPSVIQIKAQNSWVDVLQSGNAPYNMNLAAIEAGLREETERGAWYWKSESTALPGQYTYTLHAGQATRMCSATGSTPAHALAHALLKALQEMNTRSDLTADSLLDPHTPVYTGGPDLEQEYARAKSPQGQSVFRQLAMRAVERAHAQDAAEAAQQATSSAPGHQAARKDANNT